MRQSTYPLERDLGMRYYASDADGIGGRLRAAPTDFIVEEIPIENKGGTTGPFLICRLTKTNWELQHAVKEIAKRLGISHRRIGWAGTKDRNAITTQWISLYNITPEQVNAVQMKDIVLEPLRSSNEALSLGDLLGNRFDLVIRDCEVPDLAARVDTITGTVREGVPNYFGLQRFGAIRPVTHTVGEWILKGDYEQAVMTYIGLPFPSENETTRTTRQAFLDSRDPGPALKEFPVQMNYERAMLQHIYNNPGDYAGALRELPPKLLSMFVSAFQSYLFNCALSQRFDDGHQLTEPVPGDHLVFANGRTDTVTAVNAGAAAMHIKRGRCSIALFMPGKEMAAGKGGTAGPVIDALLAEHGITREDFGRAARFVETKFEGAYRPISLRADIESAPEGNAVRLKFTLPPGHYATTVCREYMKADPVRMI
ncbi:tRNA pseudouridine(13) synthase TruD [Methanoregula sp.]|uniref:tRNA pseudouridine(13) synthase TruD n=1 Tax=Methanoregula sp. TaxID=2052170 RepID=UPI00236C8C98|nr:tRNA pseudouridine(13) synthase TruD [Methanoregula sp.]MDD1685765.1 tRNA pseudouridine(13) synthase TruD [Methanoregula sp.]